MVIFFIPIIIFFTEYVQPAKISSTFPTFQDSTPVERIIKRLLNLEEEQKRKEEKIKNEKEEEKEDKAKEKEKNKEDENKKDKSIIESKKKNDSEETIQKAPEVRKNLSDKVYVIQVEGAISPPVAEFIIEGIETAQKGGAKLIVILLDTPGGLDLSMRKIIQAIESSYVPVCVFVWPVGARATSAGTFITISAHIAAMAPGTSIGAASPVMMGGQQIDEKLRKKIENDAIAYIKALGERHGRNTEWLEKAVKEAATLTAEEALKNNVIDVVAESISELIKKINGMKVKTPAGEIVIEISNYEIVRFEQNIKHKVLKVISDPNIAYILLMIGIWGIFFELANPGAIFPGVIGAICLILGLYSLQTLPVNLAGLLLIVMAIILFLLEVKFQSAGILALAGIGSMILGSLMLFKSPEPFLRASMKVIISSTLATAAFFVFVAYKGLKAQMRKSFVGLESLIGEVGEAIDDFKDGKGKIFISGEIWDAEFNSPHQEEIKKGEKVKIINATGMKLIVEKIDRKGNQQNKN
jgi:membrane-bound serine protease (ClpP class)